jgi:cytolysin (calcineurin-like family phosphatase)
VASKKLLSNNFSVDVSGLHAENSKRFVESAKPQATSYKLQATSYKLQATSYKLTRQREGQATSAERAPNYCL